MSSINSRVDIHLSLQKLRETIFWTTFTNKPCAASHGLNSHDPDRLAWPGLACISATKYYQVIPRIYLVHISMFLFMFSFLFKYVSCEFDQFKGRCSSLQKLRDTPVATVRTRYLFKFGLTQRSVPLRSHDSDNYTSTRAV